MESRKKMGSNGRVCLSNKKSSQKLIYSFYLVTANGYLNMDNALFEYYTASITESKKYMDDIIVLLQL